MLSHQMVTMALRAWATCPLWCVPYRGWPRRTVPWAGAGARREQQLLQPGAQLIGSRQRLAHRRAAHRGHARAVRPPATSPSSRPQSAPGGLPA